MDNDLKILDMIKVKGETTFKSFGIKYKRYFYQKIDLRLWLGTKFRCLIFGLEFYKNGFSYFVGPFLVSLTEPKPIKNYEPILIKDYKHFKFILKLNMLALGMEWTKSGLLIFIGPLTILVRNITTYN